MDEEPSPEGFAGLLAGGLYLVSTPIGNARDVTLRALDVLAAADVLAAEDTRNTRRLLAIHGVRRPPGGQLLPYHDHNGAAQRPRLMAALAAGRSVALVSDAGTPLVADPGYRLAADAIAAGHPVTAVPGASAALAALAVAGLPTDRFLFAGFAPPRRSARRTVFTELAGVPATLIFYESPRRLAECLGDMAEVFGPDRPAVVCRELTKRFEETLRDRLGALAAAAAAAEAPRGEVVILVGPAGPQSASEDELDRALSDALPGRSVRDAADLVAVALGLPRRTVYARALALGGAQER